MPEQPLLVNAYYPLGYFSQVDLEQFAFSPPEQFWASEERYPEAEEWLEFDFGRQRPLNFIDFEVSQKPVTIKIEYLAADELTWIPITPKEWIDPSFTINYLPSEQNPWHYFEAHFEVALTRKLRITFQRRDDPFPFPDSPLFAWSIEVRNLRAIHVIQTLDEFLEDSGVDILGNEYRTDLEVFDAENVADGEVETFWQSQPNPSSNAVEFLYFDLRQGWRIGTMGWCNTNTMSEQDEIEGQTMNDIRMKFLDGAVIDEVYVDPVTVGPQMNIYYSLDDLSDWEDKLWIPIPRHYTLRRGFHSLPTPTFVKFVKLEFTRLAPAPYNTLEYPDTKPVEYLKFPTWVQHYFFNIFPLEPQGALTQENVEQIKIDPTELGFMNPVDRFNSQHSEISQRPGTQAEVQSEISRFIKETVSGVELTPTDNEIVFNPPTLFSQGLEALLDVTRSLSRYVRDFVESPWTIEGAGITELEEPVAQSRFDLEQVYVEKNQPTMFFPRSCRHGYQIIEAIRPSKIAYFVAIREVTFHRRDYTVEFDEPFYHETLDDDDHVAVNEFELDNWRYQVTPQPIR